MTQIGGYWQRVDGDGDEEVSLSLSSVSDVPALLAAQRKPESQV